MRSIQLDVKTFLSAQPVFQDLTAGELGRLADAVTVRSLPRQATLFRAGQACDGLYFVAHGQAKLYVQSESGHEKVIEVIGAGDCVSEALTFSDETHTVSATTLTDALVLCVPRDVLLGEIARNGHLAISLLTRMSGRMNRLTRAIEALTLRSGVGRVVDYLLHAPVAAEAHRDHLTVALPASKGTIASLLSVTPEHFSRILHDLQDRGLIAIDRRRIHILDAGRLACV
ncbi:Crp/Fnr family transcriptional regulator [Aquabacterium sp.]|uniref:Crp/Fnr family transcriptional regulator n=1 Tax=Aquabacterium sp. TaxID=1872578 RepID=UPI0035B4E01A